jgi:hypothetical protein
MTWSKPAFRARGVLIEAAASIRITHSTPLTGNAAKFLARQMQHCALRSKARYAQEENP